MNSSEYKILEVKFNSLYLAHKNELADDARKEIEHFINHDEIEIALEAFCIEIIVNNLVLNIDEKEILLNLAEIANLNKESILDSAIWTKLQKYLSCD